jgi:intron-binding protein aquarius
LGIKKKFKVSMTDLGFFEPEKVIEEEEIKVELVADLEDEVIEQTIEKKLTLEELQRLLKAKNAVDQLYEYLFDNATLLEYHHYLEYLLKQKESKKTLISIATIANERYKSHLDWNVFTDIGSTLLGIMKLFLSDLELIEKRSLLIFVMNAFQSLDNSAIRKQLNKFVSIGIWQELSESRRQYELAKSPDRQKAWTKYLKKLESASKAQKVDMEFESSFLSKSIGFFFDLLDAQGAIEKDAVLFCERFIEFLIDLEAQLPTRRYFHALLQDHQVLPFCEASKLYELLSKSDSLFPRLIKTLAFYESFEIDELTGQAISYQEARQLKHHRMCQIQKIAYKEFPEMEDFIFASAGSLENSKSLRHHLEKLDMEKLVQFSNAISIRTEPLSMDRGSVHSRDFLIECIVFELRKHVSQLELINQVPLYPSEKLMFDDILVPPNRSFTNSHCQPLPKLNIQFLTLHDYLLRNFQLYQIESAYAIRQDIEDAVLRLNPRYNPDFVSTYDRTIFGGWARMATPLNQIQIEKVGEPRLAELTPAFVKADITYSLEKYKPEVRKEWDLIKQHDTLFLVSLQMMPDVSVTDAQESGRLTNLSGPEFKKKFGITHVRGCEVFELLDDMGDVVFDFQRATEPDHQGEVKISSHQRTLRVLLDPNQYFTDDQTSSDIYDIYGSFNVIVRRNTSLNNFKSVLESVRDLMQSDIVVPDWLTEILLGYGDRDAAHYSKVAEPTPTIDFGYTFVDWNHLTESFPGKVHFFDVDSGSCQGIEISHFGSSVCSHLSQMRF